MENKERQFEMERYYARAGSLHNYDAMRGKNNLGETMIDIKFESASEVIRYVNENDITRANNFRVYEDCCSELSDNTKKSRSDNWRYGEHNNYNTASKFLTEGKATAKALELFEQRRAELLENYPALNELQSMAMLNRKRKVFRESGDELDIDRYLNSEIEMWQTKAQSASLKRAARINIAMPTSAANNPENFTKSICFLAALSDIVESANISTELSMSFCLRIANSADTYSAYTVILKNISDQLDIERLISSGSVSLFRNWIFTIIRNIHGGGIVDSGLGSSINSDLYHSKFKDGIDADIHIYAEDVWHVRAGNKNPKVEIIIGELIQALGIEHDFATIF